MWVELVRLLCWLWNNLKDNACQLGTLLFIPSKRGLGRQSNRVCVKWDIKVPTPKLMIINVEIGLKVIPLEFETFFGACFKCNKLGHFAKNCTLAKKPRRMRQMKAQGFSRIKENVRKLWLKKERTIS